MATIKEIAERCGVSIGTVDRVLHNRGRVNPETRKRVLEAAEALNYTPNRVAQGLAARKKCLKIGFVSVDSSEHPFFRDVNDAARRKAQELEEYGAQVHFLNSYVEVDNEKGVGSFRFYPIEPSVLEALDGIVLPASDDTVFYNQIENQSLPTVFYNQTPKEEQGLAYVGCDYRKAGEIAAGLCSMAVDEKGEIALFSELSGNVTGSYLLRAEGFRSCLTAEYPECTIVGEYFFTNSYEKDVLGVRQFMQEHPNISAVYVINPGNYGICQAIRAAMQGKKVCLVTNDLVDIQKQMLRDGTISATITQEPEKQGAMPLDILFNYLVHGIRPKEWYCYTDLSISVADELTGER